MVDNTPLSASLWAATAGEPPATMPLKGAIDVDVAIVGGGFSGCSTALHLAERGVSVALLEAEEIGWGGSGRNAGLVNAGLWVTPEEIIAALGPAHGNRLIDGLGGAPALVRDVIDRHGIQCDVNPRGIMKGAHSLAAMKPIEENVRQWQARGAAVELLDKQAFAAATGSDRYVGGLVDHRSFTIQPLSYARGLATAAQRAGAQLFTRSPVTALERNGDGCKVTTDNGSVGAAKVVVATGAYSTTVLPELARAFVPAGCFLFATKPLSHNLRAVVLPGRGAVWDTQPAMYFARYDRDDRLIVGSLGWKPEGQAGTAWAGRALRELFPQIGEVEIDFAWAGNLDLTDDHMPWLANPAPGLHVVGGFNGRGIGQGTFWGRTIAEWLTGTPDDALPVPLRDIPNISFRSAKQTYYATAFAAYRATARFRSRRG